MATRVVEGKKPYTGGKAISIDENKVISLNLRDENNLIIYDEGDDEIYVDLQLPDGIEPTDAFPVGVTTGRAVVADGWDKAGTIISAKTTSGDEIKILYADEGTLWMDNGTGTFKQIYFKADVDAIAQAIWNYIYANCNTKSFGRSPSGQEVYDRISSGNNYALVNKEQNGNGTNTIFMFGPTNVTTGEISSFPAHLTQQETGGMLHEISSVLKMNVTDGVASNMRASNTVINNNGRVILNQSTAPSNPIEGTTWYDTTNNVLKVYDGTQWNATQAQHSTLSLTLASADWSGNTITVTATGVTASNTVIISPDPSSFSNYTNAKIYCSSQATDSLTFACSTQPSNDITVNVVILD